MIRELAENANAYTRLGPGEERIESDRFVIWFGPGTSHPGYTVVQRLRLEDDGIEESVAEIRALVAARGRRACTWEVGDSATPAGLRDRLLDLGMTPDREPYAVGMVLTEPPAGEDAAGVSARRATSEDDYVAAARIACVAFEMPARQLDELVELARRDFARAGDGGALFIADVDGRPAARASAAFTEHGVLLFGGATLPEARGRGAYRALVRARWEAAAARGTPTLVTHAGAMSRPILAALGFREVGGIHILLDELPR